jgi:hypothetical protein
MWQNPQVGFAKMNEGRDDVDRVGNEVRQFDAVVVEQRSHEVAGWDPESPLICSTSNTITTNNWT